MRELLQADAVRIDLPVCHRGWIGIVHFPRFVQCWCFGCIHESAGFRGNLDSNLHSKHEGSLLYDIPRRLGRRRIFFGLSRLLRIQMALSTLILPLLVLRFVDLSGSFLPECCWSLCPKSYRRRTGNPYSADPESLKNRKRKIRQIEVQHSRSAFNWECDDILVFLPNIANSSYPGIKKECVRRFTHLHRMHDIHQMTLRQSQTSQRLFAERTLEQESTVIVMDLDGSMMDQSTF